MRIAISTIAFLAVTFTTLAQGVSISEGSSSPHPSSMLEVASSTKGLLTPRMSSEERDAIASPADGLLIFNTTTGCFEYHHSGQWLALCGACAPAPSTALAGPDQNGVAGTSATLAGNTPAAGTGAWSILSGTGGNFSSPTDPSATFSGVAGNSFQLSWTISNSCGSSSDVVNISFASPYQPGSQTFSQPGSFAFTVPAGVTSIQLECWGAKGQSAASGNGGYARGTLSTSPGAVLHLFVGGRDGANGGGVGSAGYNGGGASDVRSGGTSLNDRIIVAGGGGGGFGGNHGSGGAGGGGNACADGAGGGGGIDCGSPCAPYTSMGGAGTCSSGGASGYSYGGFTGGAGGGGLTGGGTGANHASYGTPGGNGSLGQGGNAGSNNQCSQATSAGGGGGYYGGGGSAQGQCYAGGAGGGSSWASPALSNRSFSGGVNPNDGYITLTW